MKRSLAFQIIFFALFCVLLFSACFSNTAGEYTITFVSNGGSSVSSITIGNGSNTVIWPEPTRDGYIFDGWFTDKLLTSSLDQYLAINGMTISSNMTLYAKWAQIAGEITLNVNGGDPLEAGISPVQYATGVATNLPVPTRTGNTFTGWYDSASYTTSNQMTDSTGVLPSDYDGEGDITFYAHWQVKVDIYPYTEAGSVNAGRGYYIIGGINNNDILTFTATPATHYTFEYWYFGLQQVATSPYTHTFTEDVVIIAAFQGEETTLTANSNFTGGEVVQHTVHYGETLTLTVPTRPGYVFEGWYDATESGIKVSDRRGVIESYPYYEDITLYAQWQEGTFSTDFTYEGIDSPITQYRITGYEGSDSELYIPYDLGGIPVTEISAAFNASGYGASKIIIPSSITSISPSAFTGYTGNIFFDRGMSNLSLINNTNFNTSHNIFVHGDYVVSSNITSSSHSNTYSSGNASLIDDFYFNFMGYYTDTQIGSEEELQAMINYLIVYSVDNEVAFTINYGEGYQEMGPAIQHSGFYRSNTDSTGSIEFSYLDSHIKMNALEEKTTNRLASKSTAAPNTIELAPPFISSYTVNETPEARDFPIDSANPYIVYNTEQLVYAVEAGFKPVFLEDGPAKIIYNQARSILEEIIPTGADVYEKITIIHDWILLNNKYDHELLNLSTGGTPSSELLAYNGFYLDGVFTDGKAVCDGISKAFMLMARIEGIEAIRVSGTTVQNETNVGHAWNKVKISGLWYALDLTGDDVSVSFAGPPSGFYEIPSHRYFLIEDDLLAEKNTEDPDEDNPFYTYHYATGSYDYFDMTLYDTTHDLYIINEAERSDVANEFIAFVNTQAPGRYAIELVYQGNTMDYFQGFGSCSHTTPSEIGDTGTYFVVIMIDKN